MDGSRFTIGLLLAVTTTLAPGCTSAIVNPQSNPLQLTHPDAADPVHREEGYGTSTSTPDAQTLNQIMAEVQQLGTLDPTAREQLLADLKQTDPRFWPLLVERVRATVALKRRAEERESQEPQFQPQPRHDVARADGPPVGTPGWSEYPGETSDQRDRFAADRQPTSQPSPTRYSCSPGHFEESPRENLLPSHLACSRKDGPGEDSGRVVHASYNSESLADWKSHLLEAAGQLDSEVTREPRSDVDFAQHARLRMLHLLAGRRDMALEPIPGMDPAMQEFWSEQLYGLAALLEPQLFSEPSRRKAEAKEHLAQAACKLGESCPLVVRKLSFVTVIQSYGSYEPFEKYEFQPSQRVLLYAEVENLKSEETARGFHSSSRSSYQIFDSSGRRVAQHEFSTNEEHCRNRRRDFFIVYDFHLPKQIFPGRHTLQLTVVDRNSQKIGQSLIEFAVKSAGE